MHYNNTGVIDHSYKSHCTSFNTGKLTFPAVSMQYHIRFLYIKSGFISLIFTKNTIIIDDINKYILLKLQNKVRFFFPD